jgi:hypothetical protein
MKDPVRDTLVTHLHDFVEFHHISEAPFSFIIANVTLSLHYNTIYSVLKTLRETYRETSFCGTT